MSRLTIHAIEPLTQEAIDHWEPDGDLHNVLRGAVERVDERDGFGAAAAAVLGIILATVGLAYAVAWVLR